jgi:AmmeMemoRadiSam system protein B
MKKPQLRRDIQPVPVIVEGRQMITFIDPLQLSSGSPAVEKGSIAILRMLDGTRDLRDIQMEMMRMSGGGLVSLATIDSFINQLDQAYLLESERFIERKRLLVEEFESSIIRQPCLAGKSYDDDPSRLGSLIEDTENNLTPLSRGVHEKDIAGLLAPHIDITLALDVYVDVYRRLRSKSYDLVIVLGINHKGSEGLFCVSDKTYITPFGNVSSDRDFVAQIRKRVAADALIKGDFDHKTEHSIEFQTVFLKHFLEGEFKIVPILCGGIYEFITAGRSPFEDDRFTSMVQVLTELIDECRGRVLLVSGVDFSHIGPKFGHNMPAANLLARAHENDESIIACLKNSQPEKIFEHTLKTLDQYNVCGLSSMLVFSSLVKGCSAQLLAYRTYDEQATRSAVSYASMVFARP